MGLKIEGNEDGGLGSDGYDEFISRFSIRCGKYI